MDDDVLIGLLAMLVMLALFVVALRIVTKTKRRRIVTLSTLFILFMYVMFMDMFEPEWNGYIQTIHAFGYTCSRMHDQIDENNGTGGPYACFPDYFVKKND